MEEFKRAKLGSQEFKDKISKSSKDYWTSLTEEERAIQCQKIKDSWTPERREARRKMLAERLADPEASAKYRANLSKAVREANLRPDVIEKRKISSQIACSDPKYREKLVDRMNQPWNVEINKRVNGPLAHVTLSLKKGLITSEEAEKQRQELYIIKKEIHEKYKEEERVYNEMHPPKKKRSK